MLMCPTILVGWNKYFNGGGGVEQRGKLLVRRADKVFLQCDKFQKNAVKIWEGVYLTDIYHQIEFKGGIEPEWFPIYKYL